jgi:hypothetical protein
MSNAFWFSTAFVVVALGLLVWIRPDLWGPALLGLVLGVGYNGTVEIWERRNK